MDIFDPVDIVYQCRCMRFDIVWVTEIYGIYVGNDLDRCIPYFQRDLEIWKGMEGQPWRKIGKS